MGFLPILKSTKLHDINCAVDKLDLDKAATVNI